MRRLLLVCVTLLLPLCVMLAQSSQPGRFTVSGTVVNSATGEPVRGAQVHFNGPEARTVMAGADGRFEMDAVPAGQAWITAQRPGFAPDNQPRMTTIGAQMDAVVIKLDPFSKISGHIMAQDGEPIEGVNVQCMVEAVINGRRQWQPVGGAMTNEAGQYVIENLMPGTYVLGTNPTPLYQGVQPKSEASRYVYPARFYPDAPSRELAQKIEVASGDEGRADMALSSIRGVKVSFRPEPSHPNLFATLNPGDNNFGFMGRMASGDGTGLMTFSAVAPGSWKIEAHGSAVEAPSNAVVVRSTVGAQIYGELPVEVGNTDIDNLHLPVSTLPDIPVSLAGAENSGMFLQLTDENGQGNVANQDPNSKRFEFRSVMPGSYRVAVQPRETCIASMMSGSVDLLQDRLVVSAGSAPPIQITGGDNCPTLTVSAKTKGAGSVIVVSDSKAFEPIVSGASEQGYTMTLHQGEYRIYALDDITNLEYANPEAMRNFKSQTVVLDAGQKLSVQVEIEERHSR